MTTKHNVSVSLAGGTPAPARVATYRLQLRPGFGFREAAELVPYLRDLGISHVYCSPSFQAAAGSTHGYDVADPTRVSEELGGDEGWLTLRDALRRLGMTQLLDIVPNHMSTADRRNRWWWDVLADGRSSPWAPFFDIDWEPNLERLVDRVLLPVLPDHLGRVIEAGGISVVREDGALVVAHAGDRYPLRIETVVALVAEAVPAEAPALVAAVEALAPGTDDDSRRLRLRERFEVLAVVTRILGAGPAADAVDAVLGRLNADVARLDAVLEDQHHRLARWQTGVEEVNYRRFFDITSLVALRVNDPVVFHEVTAMATALVRRGDVDGLRIDHVDGLSRPLRFAADLRDATGPGAWLLAEKILDRGEEPPAWELDGTSGYDFLAVAGGLFLEPAGMASTTAWFERLSGDDRPFAAVARDSKREVLDTTLVSDVGRVTALLATLLATSPAHRDHTHSELTAAIVELAAATPRYRTYIDPDRRPASATDVNVVHAAAARVREAAAGVDARLLGTLESLLVSGDAAALALDTDDLRRTAGDLVLRFQQLCATATAKGVEDRAFYRHVPLVACNEVGASPADPCVSVEEFHAHNLHVQAHRPHTLLATSTHDTKRAEDVRCRLAVLSEMPAAWTDTVSGWRTRNAQHRAGWDDPVTEYLLYQTLVGAHPLPAERARAYMEKASREAAVHTGWLHPDAAWDAGLAAFVDAVCADGAFMTEVAGFVESLHPHDRVVSLSTVLLRFTSPGIPDTYQGTELWDLSLVDPDNRRPVDWELRRSLLASLAGGTVADAWRDDADGDGAAKLALVRDAVALRRRHAAAFDERGDYRPVRASGCFADDVIAFTRGGGGDVLTVAVRGSLRRNGSWGDTHLTMPPGRWRNLLDATVHEAGVPLASLLRNVPVALCERAP